MSLTTGTLMDIRDVAAELGLSRRFLYERVQRGDIPCLQAGRRIKVYALDVICWLARNYCGRIPQTDDERFWYNVQQMEERNVSRSK